MSKIDKEVLLQGLSDKQIEESKKEFGINELSKKEQKSILKMFLESFKDIWIMVLVGALALKVFLGIFAAYFPQFNGENDFIEIISIAMAIGLATGFSTLSEYRNSSRSEALQEEYSKTFSKVIRNGRIITIPTSEIVKGEVILIQAGDKVPVDGLVFEGRVKVSQAALNGESREEDKIATDSMEEALSTDYSSKHKIFMGSVVTSGEGYMLATVIGNESELGKINSALTDTKDEERKDTSSLKLEQVAKGIGKVGVSAAVLSGVLHIVLTIMRADAMADTAQVVIIVANAIMLMASIVIMAVPEGLPMMNSLVQSMNTESMYKKNILVSKKAAFSDSAYMDILYSDKTGTITEGNLSLVEFINGEGEIVPSIQYKEFVTAITLNNLSKVSEGKAIGSNNMDRALLNYAISKGYKEDHRDMDKVREISGFDSEKKCATMVMKDGTTYWKGATENIIEEITHYILEDGLTLKEFSSENKKNLEEMMKKQANRTMKLLSVAKIVEDKKILLAVLCLRDNVRRDAIETVEILNKAGIQVVMVTGDAEETAVAIAKEAGILKEESGDVFLTHDELAAMTDAELKEKIPHLKVVSRAKPLDKKRLVKLAQSLDHVVGMTGDGVNDAPALKRADTGFAMGDGTAVAQEAGDVVILNNSLTSIKDCILNSRTMAKSVGKFLIFQLTVNISTLFINIISPILGWHVPFSIVQILWINLIMDTLAAMAFGSEPILERYMEEKPAKRTDNILTKNIRTAIGTAALFITVGSFIIVENIFGITNFIMPEGHNNPELYKRTFMFAFFVYSIIFNSLNTRSEKLNVFEHIGENKKFGVVMGGIFALQTIIIQIGGSVFSTTTLGIKALVVSVLMALMIIPVDLARKFLLNR